MSSDEALQEQRKEREKTTDTFPNGEGKGEGGSPPGGQSSSGIFIPLPVSLPQ